VLTPIPGIWGLITEDMKMLERAWRILGGLFLIGVGVALAWYHGPLLVRDFGIGNDVVPATQARLAQGRCKSRLVIYFCDLQIDQARAGTTKRTELNYLFVDFSFGDYSVRVLSPKGDASSVTTDIGQGMLWNRAITLAGALIFCLAAGIVLPFSKTSGRAQDAPGVTT
jgi:hypothetical protein